MFYRIERAARWERALWYSSPIWCGFGKYFSCLSAFQCTLWRFYLGENGIYYIHIESNQVAVVLLLGLMLSNQKECKYHVNQRWNCLVSSIYERREFNGTVIYGTIHSLITFLCPSLLVIIADPAERINISKYVSVGGRNMRFVPIYQSYVTWIGLNLRNTRNKMEHNRNRQQLCFELASLEICLTIADWLMTDLSLTWNRKQLLYEMGRRIVNGKWNPFCGFQ